ncbi:hypothetical protein [uncultured Desulfosarcina sp.]|uniref:hypothetical protein n=1 Tax=uncultured Desulfosarcina sp. TaxID=218289 RepID=UPI0029C62179|nr:hypothetical protein [uncultured Desulfosarcina sp.]
MQAAEQLVRKQFLIYPGQIKKLNLLAKNRNTSAAEMVRKAIDAYDPDATGDLSESELLELVSTRVKEAIADTRKTRKQLERTLKLMNAKDA